MNSNNAVVNYFVAPSGAGPDEPAATFGDVQAVPPEVTAYYAALSGAPNKGTVIAIIQLRRDSSHYDYLALVVPTDVLQEPYTSMGTCRFGIVSEAQRWTGISGGSAVALTSKAGFLKQTWTWQAQALGDELSAFDWDTTNGVNPAAAVAIPRGTRLFVSNNTSDLAVNSVGYANDLSGAMTYRSGRAYRVEWGGACLLSLATNAFAVDIFINGVRCLGGAYGPSGAPFSIDTSGQRIVANYGASDKTYTTQVSATTSAGTGTWLGGGVANAQHYMLVQDIGAAALHPNAFSVV